MPKMEDCPAAARPQACDVEIFKAHESRLVTCLLPTLRTFATMTLLACAGLLINPAHAQSMPDAEVWGYQISAGDTLIGISAQFLENPDDWPKLQKLNNVANERRLVPETVLRIPLALMKRTATVASVVFVKGLVTLVTRDATGVEQSRQLAVGDTVQARDTIRTAIDASISLRFADKSRLMISPGSELSIVHLLQLGKAGIPRVDLQIRSGGADVQVAPAQPGRSFEIRTPAVNLGVRGTDFRARVDAVSDVAHVEVREGRVGAAADRQQITVNGGFGTVAEPGKPIAPPQKLIAAPQLGKIERLERLPLRFSWPAVAAAEGYRAQILEAREIPGLLLDGEFPTPSARWPDLPDGSYQLRVRAIDARGNEGIDAVAGFVLKARPEPPFTNAPADGSKSRGDSARFEWAKVFAARTYRLQVSRQADFSTTVFDDATIATNSHIVTLEPGLYHWRVASIAAKPDGTADAGPFGDSQSFTQMVIPPSPPLEPSTVGPDGIVLRWKTPDAGQTTRYQIASDPEYKQILLDQTTQQSSGLLPKPEPGSYFIRARTVDADGFEGPFGASQQIDVPQPPPPKWLLLLPLGMLLLIL